MLVDNPCAPDFRVMKQAESLASAGHDVCVFCLAELGLPEDTVMNGVRYRRIAMRGGPVRERDPAGPRASAREARLERWLPLMLACQLRRLAQPVRQPLRTARLKRAFVPALKGFHADVIHAHDLPMLPVAAATTRQTGAALIFDSHELEAHRNPPLVALRRWQVERLQSRLLPRAALVVTVSERIADVLATTYGIRRPLVLFNAPRLADLAVDRPPLPDIRALAGAPPEARVIVYTGNVIPGRGLEVVIRALGLLRRSGNGIAERPLCLVALGACTSLTAAALTSLARSEGVADRVFLVPPVPPDQVSAQISTADAAVIPILPMSLSYRYAMPNKLFEAVMAGLPVIASDLDEMGEFVRRHRIGAVSPPADPTAMAQAISAALDAPTGQARPSGDLRQALSWEVQAAKLLLAYENLERHRCGRE